MKLAEIENIINGARPLPKLPQELAFEEDFSLPLNVARLVKILESSEISIALTAIEFHKVNDEGMDAIAEELSCCENLKVLRLGISNLTLQGLKILKEMLEGLPEISALHFYNGKINDDQAPLLEEIIKSKPSLTELGLVGNSISIDDIFGILDVAPKSLMTLDLSDNNLGQYLTSSLSSVLRNFSQLKSLKLANNPWTSEDIAYLFAALVNLQKLEYLDVAWEGRPPEDFIELLIQLQKENPSLKEIKYKQNEAEAAVNADDEQEDADHEDEDDQSEEENMEEAPASVGLRHPSADSEAEELFGSKVGPITLAQLSVSSSGTDLETRLLGEESEGFDEYDL